jgi:hypothetical protein
MEVYVSMICACLVCIRPLLMKCFPFLGSTIGTASSLPISTLNYASRRTTEGNLAEAQWRVSGAIELGSLDETTDKSGDGKGRVKEVEEKSIEIVIQGVRVS